MPSITTKKALIVVRTYAVPSDTGIESSCTAAITDRSEWLRLYPVPWRLLARDQRFRKYQWVEVDVTKAKDDPRPESYHLMPDGVRISSERLSSGKGWLARKEVVLPLRSHSLCCLTRHRDAHQYPTLGIFRPRSISRLLISPDDRDWTESQRLMLSQQHLFAEAPQQELQKIPYVFRYKLYCDDVDCRSHTLMCTDWEMGESYRKWNSEYGDAWKEKFRLRYESEMINRNDTHFYVGTVLSHPHRWIIIGLFYPPRTEPDRQGSLF